MSDRRPSGITPELMVWQLVHRVFGRLHPDWVGAVLDYHGLDGRPADPLAVLAARRRISVRTVSGRVKDLRAAADLQVQPDAAVVARATRASTPTEDHRGRVRVATTLHVPAPEPATPPTTEAALRVLPAQLAVGRAGIRLLATVGPLDVDSLLTAIDRCRRFRVRGPLTATGLVAALDALGATRGPDGCWRAPAGTTVPERYRSIVRVAAGATLTRQEMIGTLIAAGYSTNSANGRMSTSHPLFEHTGPGRYAIIGSGRGV